MVELVSIRNMGEQPVDMRRVYFLPEGNLGGSPENDRPASDGDRVPRLWGRPPGDAWLDNPERGEDAAGLFWGAVAPDDARVRVHFWLDEHGNQHPDACADAEATLAPGETFAPPQPLWLILIGGQGHNTEQSGADNGFNHAAAAIMQHLLSTRRADTRRQ
jgi:hypothetical protein